MSCNAKTQDNANAKCQLFEDCSVVRHAEVTLTRGKYHRAGSETDSLDQRIRCEVDGVRRTSSILHKPLGLALTYAGLWTT